MQTRKIVISIIAFGAIFVMILVPFLSKIEQPGTATSTNLSNNQSMQLSSSAFAEGQTIPALYTCDGKGINPPLSIAQVPAGASSLVLVVDDPDAPAGIWTHWTVWNISPTVTEIAENSLPTGGVQGTNSSNKVGWDSPCPPAGSQHHYVFSLYALDGLLDLPATTDRSTLIAAMQGKVLAAANFVGLYR